MSGPVERSSKKGQRSTDHIPQWEWGAELVPLGSQDLPSTPPFPKIYVFRSYLKRLLWESLGTQETLPSTRSPSQEWIRPEGMDLDPPAPKGFEKELKLVPLGSQEDLPSKSEIWVQRAWLERIRLGSVRPQQAPPSPAPWASIWAKVPHEIPQSSTSQQADEPEAHQGDIPITDLETHHLRCRILIQPRDPSNFKADPSHQKSRLEHLRHRAVSGLNTVVECIAVMQGIEEPYYIINAPLRCRLCYDSQTDSIAIVNTDSSQAIMIRHVIDMSTDQEQLADAVIKPLGYYLVRPGAWAVRSCSAADAYAFQFKIYPRTLSLLVLQTITLPSTVGSRRKHDHGDKHVMVSAPADRCVAGAIANICDANGGDIVRIADGDVEEYLIHRLQQGGHNTHMSTVFRAKVSKYPDDHAIVKYIKGADNVQRARSWQKEYRLHIQLQYVSQFNPLTLRKD